MQCTDFKCPTLTCAANEVEAHKEDACCGYCDSDWVKVGESLSYRKVVSYVKLSKMKDTIRIVSPRKISFI